jgi:DNA-binding GntR family transcriptional regulator
MKNKLQGEADREIRGMSIKRLSMAGQVAGELRERILCGELRPGAPLQEIPLAASAGVSRNTVREAIQILVREGLARHNVHRGGSVTQLTDKDINDIYCVRRSLEIAGVRAAANAEPGRITALDAVVDEMRRACETKDWLQSVTSDILFHRHIVAFLQSDRLDEFFGALLSELRLGLVLVDRTTFSGEHLAAQHSELVELLGSGRLAECEIRLLEHLSESEQNLREVIETQSSGRLKEVPASFSL